jgi:hypothetical protein
VITFGAVITDEEAYRRYAGPGIDRVKEPGSAVHALSAVASAAFSLNLLLDIAARDADLEALVIVHTHLELDDPSLCATVRDVLVDPDVAVVGSAGGRGVRGLAWWEGEVFAGGGVHRYQEHGGGEVPAYAWADPGPVPAEVDAIDGVLMVLSPWAVRELRFDEDLWLGYGVEVDYCLRVRAAGRKVVAADLRGIHHRSLDVISDPAVWAQAHLQLGAKLADGETDWKARARRAEAEREAARISAYFNATVLESRVARLEQAFAEAVASPGWRLTEPLRRVNAWRRARRS